MPIRFKASDPDGFLKKLELFDQEKSLGEATLRSEGEYELIYKDVAFGRHWVTIVATDNLGRVATEKMPEFFVNGTVKLEITNPKAGSKLNKADGEFTVTIHAVSGLPLKRVALGFYDTDATAVGNDDYVVKVKNCARKCGLQAIAIDEQNVEARSEPVELTIVDPPKPSLRWFDGEYLQRFEAGTPFKVSQLILMAAAEHETMFEPEITKIEILVNGVSLCTDSSAESGAAEQCVWTPSPGTYKLQVIATDIDGAVGKSDPIEVVIERP